MHVLCNLSSDADLLLTLLILSALVPDASYAQTTTAPPILPLLKIRSPLLPEVEALGAMSNY